MKEFNAITGFEKKKTKWNEMKFEMKWKEKFYIQWIKVTYRI